MRIVRLGLLLSLVAGQTALSQECRPARTALVLSGGGVKGLAHLGVLRTLDSLGIRPDLIVGTSMGAIVGALYATGYDARAIDSLLAALPISEIVTPFRPPAPHPWDGRLPHLFLVRGRRGFTLQTGIVDEAQPNARLNAAMLHGNLTARGRFDRLPIPFLAVATDLRDRSTVVLGQGDLARAIRASSAIPLVFPPVVLGDSILVDGGLSANIPVAEARAAGAERVIVSDVTEHPQARLDVESPLALADQLLGFLFQQAPAKLGPDDIMVRPAVQGYRSLDFSAEAVADVLSKGRQAADSTIGRARCLPRGPSPTLRPLPGSLTDWRVRSERASDSILVSRMLRLEAGAPLDPVRLADRLVGLADAEALRGVWLNPTGTDSAVSFSIDPLESPSTVGGAGVAYDHEQGGKAWAGLFARRAFGTTLEASGLLSLGRLQRELYGTALWHFDAGWSRLTPIAVLRLRTEDVRRFDPDGVELPAIGTSDLRAGLGLEVRVGTDWRIRAGGDLFVWGAEPLRGRSAGGGALRLERAARNGPRIRSEMVATSAFQSAHLTGQWPLAARRWRFLPTLRAGIGADLPLQWSHALGGDEGFPGLHVGERRGTREVYGAVRAGIRILGPLEARFAPAVGRAWTPGVGGQDWVAGFRIGLGADTPVGPLEAAWGFASGGRDALYLRLGAWF